MGAENERDPATEPDDEPRGALQRAGAGGLEGGRGGGGGEDPPAKRHTYIHNICSLLLIYSIW